MKIEITISLLIWELAILVTLVAMLIYLTRFHNKIPASTLKKLQMTCILSIGNICALLSQFLDDTPAFFCIGADLLYTWCLFYSH